MLAALVFAVVVMTARGFVQLRECTWLVGKLHVSWEAPSDITADYYEVQVSNSKDSNVTAIFSTRRTTADLDFLLSDMKYWLKVRAHVAGTPSFGPGTWQEPGLAIECKTGAAMDQQIASKTTADSFLLEVMRQSEYTYDVDYLANHNSGDISGDTSFVVQAAVDPTRPGFLNTTFKWSTFTLYCIDVLAVHVPNTITTDGNTKFADYLSCDDNNNATNPLCGCDNGIDRWLSKASDQMKYCSDESGGLCKTPFRNMSRCKCNCTKSSLAASAKYVGMMPVYYNQPELLGYWYSHPKETECLENETVGDVRGDGSHCTWKRRGEARVLRGDDVLNSGWNVSRPVNFTLEPAVVKQNAEVFRHVFDSQPYRRWSCSEELHDRLPMSLIV